MAHADDKIVSIRSAFGMWGIGTYWTLVERSAEQMTAKKMKPEASLLIPELCSFLGCKRNKLDSFLKHLKNIHAMDYHINGDVLIIKIPKLRILADNYTRYDGLSLKTLQRQKEMSSKQDTEVDTDKEKEEERYTSILNHWNSTANQYGLAAIIRLSDKRRKAVDARLKESDFDFEKIVLEIAQSEFLRGSTGWRVDFDFVFCSANNYLKILEGKYRGSNKQGSGLSGEQKAERDRAFEESIRRTDAERAKRTGTH